MKLLLPNTAEAAHLFLQACNQVGYVTAKIKCHTKADAIEIGMPGTSSYQLERLAKWMELNNTHGIKITTEL